MVGTIIAVSAAPARADTFVYVNGTPVTIPDGAAASVYPSKISVSGLVGSVNSATVTLTDLSHGNGSDLDILLTGPQGQKVMLMQFACQGVALSHVAFGFSPTAAALIPASVSCPSGTYLPSSYSGGCDGTGLPSPAPAPPYGNSMSSFTGIDPNGSWSLFVVDTCPGSTGTLGGWSLTLDGPQSTPNPVAKKKKCKKKKKKKEDQGKKGTASSDKSKDKKKKKCKAKKKGKGDQEKGSK